MCNIPFLLLVESLSDLLPSINLITVSEAVQLRRNHYNPEAFSMFVGRGAHAVAKYTTGHPNSLAGFRFTVLYVSQFSPVFCVTSKYSPVSHLLKERPHPGGGKTTGNECLLLLSSLRFITDKECRLNREHWCLTGQTLYSSFNCLNKMFQDPLGS